jgi:hypothetical protein
VLLFALGYGTEGKNDVGEQYTFVMGDKKALPVAATLGMVGMREGGVHSLPVLHAQACVPTSWRCPSWHASVRAHAQHT